MDRLNKEKVDHIWSRIIKNNIVSSSVGKFDYVIGNPPWIRWGYMSQDYRNATLELWKKYGLFSLKGMMARLGSGEKDFSMLFLYTCADNYLKVGGTLGFLITQEVIKSKGAGEGFRRFELGNTKMYLKVKEFHDFVTIEQYIYTVICIKSSQKAVKPPPKLGLICKEWPRQGNQPIIHPSICVSEGLFYRTFFSDERLAADAAAAATHQPIHLWTFEITTIYIV